MISLLLPHNLAMGSLTVTQTSSSCAGDEWSRLQMLTHAKRVREEQREKETLRQREGGSERWTGEKHLQAYISSSLLDRPFEHSQEWTEGLTQMYPVFRVEV